MVVYKGSQVVGSPKKPLSPDQCIVLRGAQLGLDTKYLYRNFLNIHSIKLVPIEKPRFKVFMTTGPVHLQAEAPSVCGALSPVNTQEA